MKKTELSKEELKERNLFVSHLKKAGWSETGINQMFDDGDFVSEEAQMEFANDQMSLLLEFSTELRGFKLYLTANSGKEANFVIQYEEKFAELLDLITSFQHKISSRNYKTYMQKILDLCPQTFVDVPEKGLHQLVGENQSGRKKESKREPAKSKDKSSKKRK